MMFQMVTSFAVIVFLLLLAGGYQLGFDVGFWYVIGALLACTPVSLVLVLSIVCVADWSERRTRARRRAKANQQWH